MIDESRDREAESVMSAIVALCVEKGVFTFEEYETQVAKALSISDQDEAADREKP